MENWKDIDSYEGLYQISDKGNVKSFLGYNGHKYYHRVKLLNPWKQKSKGAYERYAVNLIKEKEGHTFKVHQLVARAFIPNVDNKPEINHIDGNPLNNNVNNLEWCTRQENMIHAYKLGLKDSFKISKKELEKLYHQDDLTPNEIGKIFNVNKSVIHYNLKRHSINSKSTGVRRKHDITTEFLIRELKSKTQSEIAREVGCGRSLINHYAKRLRIKGDINA